MRCTKCYERTSSSDDDDDDDSSSESMILFEDIIFFVIDRILTTDLLFETVDFLRESTVFFNNRGLSQMVVLLRDREFLKNDI